MLLNATFTVVLKTSENTAKATQGIVEMTIFLVLDLSRMICNLIIVVLGHRMRSNEIPDMFYKNLSNSNPTERSNSFSTMVDPEEDLNEPHKYFICNIEQTQTFHENGYFFHAFSVIFKPSNFQRKHSRYLSQSLIRSRTETENSNEPRKSGDSLNQSWSPLQESLNKSFELINPKKRLDDYSEYLKEITKELQKTPHDIATFAKDLELLDNPLIRDFEFFNDIENEDLNLKNLEDFLNTFMNQTYKVSSHIRNTCPTLNCVKVFLELNFDHEMPSLLTQFSLQVDFPHVFIPNRAFFKKVFTRFIITEIKIFESKKKVELRVLNRQNQKFYFLRKEASDIFNLLQTVHPYQKSIDMSHLSSEKKQTQLVSILHILLNEIEEINKLSRFLGEEVKVDPPASFSLPKFQVQVTRKSSSFKEDPLNVQDADQNEVTLFGKRPVVFEVKVCSDMTSGLILLERTQTHFEVLANHLVSRFGDDKFSVKKRMFQEPQNVKKYLLFLMTNKEVWKSVEFQLFLQIARSDFSTI
jgi:hypothetical protein